MYTACVAHRGWSARYPENTLISFASALQLGVDGLEFDVHRTRDGEMVVLHDPTLDRTTDGHGWVVNYTLSQLQTLDAGRWFSDVFIHQRIPTLRETLDLVQQNPYRVWVNIEIKDGQIPYVGLGRQVWDCVVEMGMESQVVVSSMNHEALRDLKRERPLCPIAILYQEHLVDPWRYGTFLRAEALHPHYRTVTPEIIHNTHEAGQRIRVFTVNNKEDMSRQLALGVDGIITDHPDVLLRLRGRFGSGRRGDGGGAGGSW